MEARGSSEGTMTTDLKHQAGSIGESARQPTRPLCATSSALSTSAPITRYERAFRVSIVGVPRRRWRAGRSRATVDRMSDPLTLTAVFTPDEDGWTMAQLAEWPAVVTCGRTVEEARELLLDAAREMVASYRDEGREPPLGGGHVEQVTIDIAAA